MLAVLAMLHGTIVKINREVLRVVVKKLRISL